MPIIFTLINCALMLLFSYEVMANFVADTQMAVIYALGLGWSTNSFVSCCVTLLELRKDTHHYQKRTAKEQLMRLK
jgi:hypothetical protein